MGSNPLPTLGSDLTAVVRALVARHGCHAILLYGSRARGEEDTSSDYDIACVREGSGESRDTAAVDGLDPFALDAFVYGEEALVTLKPDMGRMRGGRVIHDERGYGAALLARIEAMAASDPKPLPAWELAFQEAWCRRMLARIEAGGIEGHFRRVQLLNDFQEIYFTRRAVRFEGVRRSFAWLRDHDPRTHDALERALEPTSGIEDLRALVERLLGEKR
jgi:predicted nucleotidyltransferase